MRASGVLWASTKKELLVGLRSWRVLAYCFFLAAVILLGSNISLDDFPYEVATSQGPLLTILALGCAFIFAADAVSREHERGTAPMLFGTPARRWALLGAKALVPAVAWAFTVSALAVSFLSLGLGTQFAVIFMVELLCATLLFGAAVGLLLFISAAVKGRGAPFAGVVAVMFMFISSGYIPVDIAGGVRMLSPSYQEYLLFDDLLDGALDSALPAILLLAEIVIFFWLAMWAFRRSEVSR
jgi:ABC-type transport system involved in multi-copper enzyme maturation permease subunit